MSQILKVEQAISFCDTPKRVLVTGATGFIGRLLVDALIADGHSVTVLTRNPHKAQARFNVDLHCVPAMSDLPKNYPIDVVINLAGARVLGWRWSEARKIALRKSRITLTQNVVAWIAEAEQKPRLFLTASAIGYYGIQKIGDDAELTEDSHTQSIFMASLCHDWEVAARSAEKYGVQVAAMRFGLVLGKAGPLPMMILPIKLGIGGALGSGRQWLSWIHVEDLLRGIAHLWHLHFATPNLMQTSYNFTSPDTRSQLDFSRCAARVLRRSCVVPTLAWPVRLLLGEQADLLLEGQRVAPRNLLASGFQFKYPSLEKALQDLL